jgi:stage II sporulation protein D
LLITILPTEKNFRLNNGLNKDLHTKLLKGTIVSVCFLLIMLCGCRGRRQAQPTPQMNTEENQWVRILLVNDVNGCILKIDSDFTINCPKIGVEARFKKIDRPINIQLNQGKFSVGAVDLSTNRVIITPGDPYIFNLNGRDYRGKLSLIAKQNSTLFDAVNILPSQAYLAGVIAAEMPIYWELEALKAQVIAARTYCFYIKGRFGKNREWDLGKTTAYQVYQGVNAESQPAWKAVNQTDGMVLTCRQPNGSETIFPTYFSSTCGGHTESSKNVFGDSYEPLSGVPCPYCIKVARSEIFSWPMVQFSKLEIQDKIFSKYEKLKSLADISNISVYSKSDYDGFSRVTMVELHNSTGQSDLLRAEDFRLAIDPSGMKLKSSSWQIVDSNDRWMFTAGRGFGHGVGMCQCGAEGLAREGKTAQEILQYYYPGSKIVKIKLL